MSETKHSPEPWSTGVTGTGSGYEIHALDGGLVADVFGGLGPEHPEPNRRRIVACVNACSGIPTEALEAGALRLAIGALDYVAQAPGFARMRDARVECRSALRALGRLK